MKRIDLECDDPFGIFMYNACYQGDSSADIISKIRAIPHLTQELIDSNPELKALFHQVIFDQIIEKLAEIDNEAPPPQYA